MLGVQSSNCVRAGLVGLLLNVQIAGAQTQPTPAPSATPPREIAETQKKVEDLDRSVTELRTSVAALNKRDDVAAHRWDGVPWAALAVGAFAWAVRGYFELLAFRVRATSDSWVRLWQKLLTGQEMPMDALAATLKPQMHLLERRLEEFEAAMRAASKAGENLVKRMKDKKGP